MGYYGPMMGLWGSGGMGVFGSVVMLELIIIGALLIVWLWKKVQR